MSCKGKHLFTSESVAIGHPDKLADQISDAVLDAIIAEDPDARVACETLVTTGLVFVAGEITTSCYVDIPKVARETVREVGYSDPSMGFDWETCAVITSIDEQSPDISMGVSPGETYSYYQDGAWREAPKPKHGAGDQGMMFGYACKETDDYMPLTLELAHDLVERLRYVREEGILDYLRPDGKSQVTVEYDGDKPVRIHAIVVAAQHKPDVDEQQVRNDVIEHVVKEVIPEKWMDAETRIFVNATGKFVEGGPKADCGLTGRKTIVDTYGGRGSHGGGAFSGKDPTKVDRSASYAARHIAKNIVAAELAERCEVQLAYVIGIPQPVSVLVETEGTSPVPEQKLAEVVGELYDLSPDGIIERFDLRRPIYKHTARYGHFGKNCSDMPWEQLDMVDELRRKAGV